MYIKVEEKQNYWEGKEIIKDCVIGNGVVGLRKIIKLDKSTPNTNFFSDEEFLEEIKQIEKSLSTRHAEAMLKKQKEIPREWRKYDIYFLGTEIKYSYVCMGGFKHIVFACPFISYYQGEWDIGCRSVYDTNMYSRFAVLT